MLQLHQIILALTLLAVTFAHPNFFSDGGKALPNIGRRSNLPPNLGVQTREYTGELGTAKTGAREKYQAVELAMLERSLRDIYSKLSDSNNDRNSNCLSKHEATELLKLLQAATRK